MFYIQFVKALNANRRQIVHKLRHRDIAAMIFKQTMGLYKLGPYQRQVEVACRIRSALYSNPGNENREKFSKFAPILFPGGLVEDMDKLFRCKHLALVKNLLTSEFFNLINV